MAHRPLSPRALLPLPLPRPPRVVSAAVRCGEFGDVSRGGPALLSDGANSLQGYDEVIPVRGSVVAVRKIAVTLPEELFDMVERLREIEHRSRSEVFQEALRRYFGEPVYEPTDEERRLLDEALTEAEQRPDAAQPWAAVRDGLLAE